MRIRAQLAAAVFAVGAAGILALLTDRVLAARGVLFGRLESRGQALADIVTTIALPHILSGDRGALDRELRPLCRWPSLNYLVAWDARGDAPKDPIFQFARPGAISAGTRDQHASGATDGVYDLYFNVRQDGRVYGTVRLGLSTEPVHAALSAMLWKGAAWGAIALLALGAASWRVGGVLGRKLELLSDAVERLGGESALGLPAVDPTSEVGRLSAAFRRLHERLRSEENQRRQAEHLKEELANMLVHDLKHPLTVLKSSLALLQESGDDRDVVPIRLSKRGVERLNAMIEDLLQLARMRDPSSGESKARIMLGPFLEDCASENSMIVTSAERSWNLDIAPEIASHWIFGDKAMLRRLIGNLVLNAVDHSPAGSPVALEVRMVERDRSKVEICVSSLGGPIQPDVLKKLFRTFATFGDSPRNVGLGLAFCKIAAERHGGKLVLRAPQERNLTFALVVPVHRGGDAVEALPKAGHEPVEAFTDDA